MKLLQAWLPVIAIAGWSTSPVEAQDRPHGDVGWFLSLQAADAGYSTTVESGGTWWWDVDDARTAFAIGGGYRFSPFIGVRLTYERARDLTAVNRCPPGRICPLIALTTAADVESAALVAVPGWRFADDWKLYGTVGALHWRMDPEDAPGSERGTEAVIGAGIGYEVGGGVAVALEYQQTTASPDLEYDGVRLSFTAGF